jgi:pimeloyl-ACP methyl ester carboxylesterase
MEGEELDLLFDYFWQMTCAQPSSADHAVNILLVPIETSTQVGLFGRHALSAYPAEKLARLSMPIAVLFGSNDWIYTRSCDEFVRLVPNAKQHRLDGAGHHLYLDNMQDYHRILEEILK